MAEIIQFGRAEKPGSPDGRDAEELALDALSSGMSMIDSGRRLLQALRAQRNPGPELPPKTHPDPEDRARARRDALACPAPAPGAPISQEVRSVMRNTWNVQWARVQAAKHWYWAGQLDAAGFTANGRPDAEERVAQRDQAIVSFDEERLILMLVPAWSKEALAWKHRHVDVLADDRDQWGPVLAADEARLLARGRKGSSAPQLVTVAS